MIIDRIKKIFQDTKQNTTEALNLVEDATENKDKEQLEQERKEQEAKIADLIKKEYLKRIMQELDKENYQNAEQIALKNAGIPKEKYHKVIEGYAKIRLKQGQKRLIAVKSQLVVAESKLEAAETAQDMPHFKNFLESAVKAYMEMDHDQLLEAQRRISYAENTLQHYKGDTEKIQLFEKEVKEIHQVDRDIEQTKNELQELVDDFNGKN